MEAGLHVEICQGVSEAEVHVNDHCAKLVSHRCTGTSDIEDVGQVSGTPLPLQVLAME